jgi:hypothetical protein
MQRCLVLLALVSAIGALDAHAVEFDKIPRTIGKQPVYQSKSPKYCLLVFGPQSQTRVWLVVDGKTAYVDRNANGDLTEEGERVAQQSDGSFHLGNITEPGGATHKDLQLSIHDRSLFSLSIVTADQGSKTVGKTSPGYGDYTFPKPQFGDRPKDAPIIHPDGPLSIVPYEEPTILSLFDRQWKHPELRLTIGSPGHGIGSATIPDNHTLRECVQGSFYLVQADIEFPIRDRRSSPIKSRQTLRGRS